MSPTKAKRPSVYGGFLTRRGSFRREPKKDTEAPSWWFGSYPEWLVYQQLVSTHNFVVGTDFTFQTSLSTTGGDIGGRLELGGLIADFLLPSQSLIINPLSEYFHYRIPGAKVLELANRAALAMMGLSVVWIDSDDLLRDAEYYVREALIGRDHSKLAQNLA